MYIEVERPIPLSPSQEVRDRAMASASAEFGSCCPRCGADRGQLIEALCDRDSWENRGLAAAIIHGCGLCRKAIETVMHMAAIETEAAPDGNDNGRRLELPEEVVKA